MVAQRIAKRTKRFDEANRRLKGIESHHGFLGDETLLRIAGSDDHRQQLNDLADERMRHFRDVYRNFADASEKHLRKGDQTKYAKVLADWTDQCVSYLGYKHFRCAEIAHPEGGVIHCLLPEGDSHTVAVLMSMHTSSPLRVFEAGRLTNQRGESDYESNRIESLSEQVERALKNSGMAEAVVLLPHNAYYFRSESTTAEQCLEIQWHEIMAGDYDDALSLATFLLRSNFFSYAPSSLGEEPETDHADELTEEEESEDSDDDEEEVGSSAAGNLKVTASSLLFKEDLEQSRRITEQLHQQVVLALEFLINERLFVDAELRKKAKNKNHNEQIAYELFKDGLFVLYRILFVLYAEARGFLPIENNMFASFYSLDHLRDWSEKYLKKLRRGNASPNSTYLWGALKSIFTLLRRGVTLSGDQIVSPFNGQLFSPDRAPFFDEGPELRDEALAKVFSSLTKVGGDDSGRRLHFGNLGVEQLGAVYEALLAQKPMIIREPSVWVPAHGGGAGLVTESLADALDMSLFEGLEVGGKSARRNQGKSKKQSASKGRLDSYIDARRPAYHPSLGTFVIAPLGGAKRATASFYTPPKLAEFLVQRTLKPLVVNKSAEQILALKIVEPAMGSGGFIIATVRYMAAELLKAKRRDKKKYPELHGTDRIDAVHLQRCKREIIENCIFGVDINPLAIELARTSLYLEALVKGEPLPFLHHRLKSGNSLIGADFQGRALSNWAKDDTEFPMLFELPIQHIKIDKKLWAFWEDAFGDKKSSADLKAQVDSCLKSLKVERKKMSSDTWAQWAVASQTKVDSMLQLARQALQEFEQSQTEGLVVDVLDERHKDHLAYIPDMDPVLIEAYEVKIDETLLRKRRKALMTELGLQQYNLMVIRQRSYHRLKAMGDLSIALWYWSVDQYQHYPDHATFRELTDWLLDETTLVKGRKSQPLSSKALKALRIALKIARRLNAFHWDVEFAQIYGQMDSKKCGFDALISNPPWKVVGVKDKDVYPHFDPQFLATKPAQKKKRVDVLYGALPDAPVEWFQQSFLTSQMTEHWRKGRLSEIPPEGQVDLAVLFTLRNERIIRDQGRTGLVVSRSSLFVNKATKNIRQRFFHEWGLGEACSFANNMKIFEIDSRIEFTLLIGQHGKSQDTVPRFVHGLIDPNALDVVARNLDVTDLKSISSGPKPAELNEEIIGRYFSKDNLSIPGITDQRQVEIAMALHKASGPVVYLDELDCFVTSGIHQTSGPKKGLSEFTENIPAHELPKWEDVLAGKVGKWVPVYSGKNFNILEPSTDNNPQFSRYTSIAALEKLGVQLGLPKIFWRGISMTTNQRTMISTYISSPVWADHSVWVVQIKSARHARILSLVYGSIAADTLVKLGGGANRTFGEISSLPIPNYDSASLRQALELTEVLHTNSSGQLSKEVKAEIDALVWIHFGMGRSPLGRTELQWVLETQFDCLNRHDPDYKNLVIAAYDEYVKDPKMTAGPTGTLFQKKVVDFDRSRQTTEQASTKDRSKKRVGM